METKNLLAVVGMVIVIGIIAGIIGTNLTCNVTFNGKNSRQMLLY